MPAARPRAHRGCVSGLGHSDAPLKQIRDLDLLGQRDNVLFVEMHHLLRLDLVRGGVRIVAVQVLAVDQRLLLDTLKQLFLDRRIRD